MVCHHRQQIIHSSQAQSIHLSSPPPNHSIITSHSCMSLSSSLPIHSLITSPVNPSLITTTKSCSHRNPRESSHTCGEMTRVSRLTKAAGWMRVWLILVRLMSTSVLSVSQHVTHTCRWSGGMQGGKRGTVMLHVEAPEYILVIYHNCFRSSWMSKARVVSSRLLFHYCYLSFLPWTVTFAIKTVNLSV